MTKRHKATLALTLFLSAVMPVVANATTAAPRKVVFFGDQFTLPWTFGANASWINKGAPGIYAPASMDVALARFQSDVVSLHPAIVHIMFGETDSEDMSPNTTEFYGPGVLDDARAMVQEAKAANIQVVFGLEPGALPQYKQIITLYAGQNSIPVINYSDALGPYAANSLYLIPDPNNSYFPIATPAGYALMTQMAAAVINTIGLKPTGGYLQNTTNWQGSTYVNVNELTLFHQAQFTPYGQYAGGLVEPFTNINYLTKSSGTWASSNPLVMYVNQQGAVWALTVGKANITYTSPSGVRFNEWTMTVESYGNELPVTN